MDGSTLVKLNVVFAPPLESRVLEVLLAQTPPLPGFTVLNGEGHGEDFLSASVREQVLGRVGRRLLFMILPSSRCTELIEVLAETFKGTRLVLWTEDVSGFRRLT